MGDCSQNGRTADSPTRTEVIGHLRKALEDGRDWPTALLEAMALWTFPQEIYKERTYNYFIAGEAFDWLLLAECLCRAVGNLLPQDEQEELLFTGRFPPSFNPSGFKDLLGVDKYRGHLNYFYGVTVEEALQLAVELEVQKRHASNGVQYKDDYTDEAFARLYRKPRDQLLKTFRGDKGLPESDRLSLADSREFTYWLFKYRLKNSDKAKIASDTRKGLRQLGRMQAAWRASRAALAAR